MQEGRVTFHTQILNILMPSISYAASTIVTMTYGKQSPSHYFDPAVQAIVRINTQLTSIMKPGALAVNQYPILVYVPGYLKTLKRWHQEELSLLKEQLAVVRQQMVQFRHLSSLLLAECCTY